MQSASIVSTSGPRMDPQLERSTYAVILASGPEDGGKRATLALAAACTVQAMNLETIVFMVGDGVYWGYSGHAEAVHIPGFPPLTELMELFCESGGETFLCSACDAVCTLPTSADGLPLKRRPEVRQTGMAAALIYAVKGSSVTL
jgi:predicted peroxiredoxin